MTKPFDTIGIYGRRRTTGVVNTLKSLIVFLTQLNKKIILDHDTGQDLATELPRAARQQLCTACDLLIVVGGDGSLLHAAQLAVNSETPVLGINRGKLGFLTDINPLALEQLQPILAGNYILESRFLLKASVNDQTGKFLGSACALNEVALLPDAAPHMSEFEIYINDQFVCSQNSDGLIVATPTGSTAYALSGGGPIVHPELDAVAIVPMFPHSLNMRPIVVNANHQLAIKISPTNQTTPRLTCDSQQYIPAPPGSCITINKLSKKLHLVHPKGYDYFETLRSKLHWGHRLSQAE